MSKLAEALPRFGLARELQAWADILEQDYPVRTETAAYTAVGTDFAILADATAGAFSVTLPPAADNKGKLYFIQRTNAGGNAITIDGNASELINGAATVSLGSQFSSRLIISDAVGWAVLASV